jgi:hypothetical protein
MVNKYLLRLITQLHALFFYSESLLLTQNARRYFVGMFLGMTCLLLSGCSEMVTANFSTVLVNLSNSYPALWILLLLICLVWCLSFEAYMD